MKENDAAQLSGRIPMISRLTKSNAFKNRLKLDGKSMASTVPASVIIDM